MKEINYIALLNKRRKKTLSLEEDRLLSEWVNLSKENAKLAKEMNKIQDSYNTYQDDFTPNVDNALAKFKKRINIGKETPVRKMKPRQSFMKIAAVLILAIGLGAVLTNYVFNQEELLVFEYNIDGNNEITLPDNSIVTLNKNGKLSYSKSFDGDVRKVYLEGEAFFEVEKNPNRPFIVDTKNATVQVLGTSFDVNIQNNMTEVFVKTGRVAFQPKGSNKKLILTPGNQGHFDTSTRTLEKTMATDNVISWKTKTLSFKKEALNSVVQTVENQFDINIEYNQDLIDCNYTSLFNKLDADVILQTLASTFGMEFKKIDATHYRLKGGSCK